MRISSSFHSNHLFREKHRRLYDLKIKLEKFYYSVFPPKGLIDFTKLKKKSIPVIINNFNRLNSLKLQIEWLLNLNPATSIIIVDNGSTYPKLTDFYSDLDHPYIQVIRLNKNLGINSLLPISMALKNFDKYIVTDADLIPYDNTPDDILEKMIRILDYYPEINHVGTSLEIDDIPDHYPLKSRVIDWEQKFWNKEFTPDSYFAPVDTTLGMYRKTSLVTTLKPALRLKRPYTLKHVDWYIDIDNLSEEQLYLINDCSECSSWNTRIKAYIKPENLVPSTEGV